MPYHHRPWHPYFRPGLAHLDKEIPSENDFESRPKELDEGSVEELLKTF
jgi:hypothetical protein